jgi:hypothetical protein
MADELEPVTQPFIADMADYIEPIDDAAADTQGFADVVEEAGEALSGLRDKGAETGAALADMAAAADDDAVSVETLAEAYSRLRDEVYETNPGIDDATAALLAEAAAADEAGLSMEAYDHSLRESNFEASGLQNTLTTLRSELAALAEGEAVAVTRSGLNEYIVSGTADLEEEAQALGRTRKEAEVTGDQIRLTGLEASEAFTGGAAAIDDYRAKLHALAVDLEDLDTVSAGVARDLEEVVGGGAGGGGGGLTGLWNLFSGGEGIGTVAASIGSLAAGMLVVAPAIAGVVIELGGLVGAAIAAGAGVGALAALAVPSLEKIVSSYTSVSQAQAAYRAAVQLERDDPSKDNLAAAATAAAKLKIAYADVPAAVRPALRSLDELKSEYSSMVKAFEPDAFKIFNDGLRVADDLLPALEPLAKGAAGAVEYLLDRLDKAIAIVPGGVERLGHLFGGVSPGSGSGGFQEFITYLSKISPAVITTIGTDLGKLAGDFAKIMESFSKQDYINAVNIAFEALSFTLGGLTRMAHNAMNFWDQISAGAKSARNWFDETRHAVAVFGRDFNDVTKQMGTDEANWANDTRRDFDDARHAVAGAWDGIRHDISSATDAINTDVSRFGSRVESDIVSAGHQIEAAWDRSWSAVVSYTRSIPGRILGALGNIGGLLVSAGERLIEGMISGIRDEAGSLVSAAEGVVGDAVSAAEHLLHIGSPSRVTWEHGRMMDEGWAGGIRDNAHLVKDAVSSMLGGLPIGIGGAGSATAAPVHITVPITLGAGAGAFASPQFLQQLQQVVQESILRYTQLNQGSGLFLPGRRS